MLIPSYDFGLFDIREFSPLQAQEFGADTYFSANTPQSYVNFALNQLTGLTQPNNPMPYLSQSALRTAPSIIPQELQDFFQQKPDNITVYPNGTLPPDLQHQGKPVPQGGKYVCGPNDGFWKRLLGICCIQAVSADGKDCVLHSDDSSVGTVNPSGGRVDLTSPLSLGALPQGAGVFLLGIIILVLLILFVRK